MVKCLHLNETVDIHEGSIICTDCAVVKDSYYVEDFRSAYSKSYTDIKYDTSLKGVILDRVNCSDYFTSDVEESLNNQKINKLDVKKVTSVIYNEVNKRESNLPLKTLMHVSGLRSKDIKSNTNIHTLDTGKLVDKYTSMLNLDFKTSTVIKEKIKNYMLTGYQPLTLIGGMIYLHCRDTKKLISMPIISSLIGISTISIQRFVKKHDLSQRT